jgi:hypothetical protein
MASIEVKGRVPVFCAWDGDVPLYVDFMVVFFCWNVFRFFCESKLKTMIFTIVTFVIVSALFKLADQVVILTVV